MNMFLSSLCVGNLSWKMLIYLVCVHPVLDENVYISMSSFVPLMLLIKKS